MITASIACASTGLSSSLPVNTPADRIGFNMAGSAPLRLQGPLADTVLAISAGAVFMGANNYIGSAPTFTVKSIGGAKGVPLPSVFGLIRWVALFLLPLLVVIALLFFLELR